MFLVCFGFDRLFAYARDDQTLLAAFYLSLRTGRISLTAFLLPVGMPMHLRDIRILRGSHRGSARKRFLLSSAALPFSLSIGPARSAGTDYSLVH